MVKAYNHEQIVISEFDAVNEQYRQHATRTQTLAGFVGPLMNFVGNSSLAIIAGFGGWMVIQGTASVGMIAAFISYSRQLGRPINEIANLYNQIQQALAGRSGCSGDRRGRARHPGAGRSTGSAGTSISTT